MNPTQTIQKVDPEKGIEFIPFGSADKIKLSVKIIQNMVAVPTKSGRTCSERDALRFLMLCQAQRLNPFAGDAFLVGYDGQQGPTFSLITAHQAFLKRAETCADFEGMESGIIILGEDGAITEREGDFHLEDEKVVGGWARVHRKNRKDTYRRIRMGRFNNGFAQWKVDPAGMIAKCAEADALRSTFPTLLGGLYTGEETDTRAERMVSAMASSRVAFEPNGLVESIPAAEPEPKLQQAAADDSNAELAPVKREPSTEKLHTVQETLAEIVTGAGHSFDDFRKWAKVQGHIPDADSLTAWDEVKTDLAKRMITAKTGMLRQMGEAK